MEDRLVLPIAVCVEPCLYESARFGGRSCIQRIPFPAVVIPGLHLLPWNTSQKEMGSGGR